MGLWRAEGAEDLVLDMPVINLLLDFVSLCQKLLVPVGAEGLRGALGRR